MNNINISIALTTYNSEKYILQQLTSLQNQILKPCEIVIYDDFSTDNTISIINNFINSSDISIKLFKGNKNIGYHMAFEKAISHCEGSFIFMCDHDDVWFKEKIQEVMNIYKKNSKIKLVINDSVFTDKNLNTKNYTKIERNLKIYKNTNNFIPGCNTSFKKELLKIILPFPKKFISYDYWINKIGAATNTRYVYHKPLQYYRRHGENESKADINKSKKNIFFKFNDFIKKNLLINKVNYQNHILALSELKKRLINNNTNINNFDSSLLDKEINAYKSRNKLIKLNIFIRFPMIIRMVINQDYNFFNGTKSIFKDMIRPRIK